MLIVSWNIALYKCTGDVIDRTENVITSIRSIDRDEASESSESTLFCIQEASLYFLKCIQKYKYNIICKVQSHNGYSCIITRMHNVHNVSPKNIGFIEGCCAVEIGENISVINCHLPPYEINKDHRAKILNTLAVTSDILIIGDMNMQNDENIIGDLKDIGKDAPSTYKNKRYDRVFSDLTCLSNFEVLENHSGISDHLPISICVNFS